jgi:hypothetical protein
MSSAMPARATATCPQVPLAVRNAIPMPAVDNRPAIDFSSDAAHDLFYDLLDFLVIFLFFGALYFYKDYTGIVNDKSIEIFNPSWLFARNPIKLATPLLPMMLDAMPPF